ncbi:MAG: polysaccharide deacetylase family protein [Hyphomicrobiaceae bacterium]
MRQVIFNFHGIGAPKREMEDGESQYWISVDFFDEILALASKMRDTVKTSFTFDDGNSSDLEIAAPRLSTVGISAEFFVLSGRLKQDGALSRKNIVELQEMGHLIGNHGADHVDWTALDEAGLTRELKTARQVLEDICRHPISSAAIPFGRYNGKVVRALKTCGYDRVYSSDGGAHTDTQYPCPRTSLTHDMTPGDVENILLGREPLKRNLRRRATMLVKRLV